MTKDEFWSMIGASRSQSNDCQSQAEVLTDLLSSLDPEDIAKFDVIFRQAIDDANRWDLWAVAYIINGGCSDDGFEYFRAWLIGRGRTYFEQAMQSPERAADEAVPGMEAECEELAYAASEAYEARTGNSMPFPAPNPDRKFEPSGNRWDESDLEALYPALSKRFNK